MNNNLEVIVGKRSVTLSKRLLDTQNAWENLDAIKECHKHILTLYTVIDEQNDPEVLKEVDGQITDIEFQLQKLWGFPQDKNFHRFWLRPKCTCPKMDNDDAYPTGYYNISGDCPLHGGKNG